MRRLETLWRSLIGQKIIMAATGLMLFLFVLAHLFGNLKVFEGPVRFNAYAEGLRTVGTPFFASGQLLWAARIVLLVSLVAHIWAAVRVSRASWAARPTGYRVLVHAETTYAARTMRWGGVLIFVYVVYHLLDLTFGSANPSFVAGNVYHNLVASFSRWPVSAVYILAMLILGLHLYHGLWSAFQSLGLNRTPTDSWRRGLAAVIAVAISAGYIVIPLSVLMGVVR